MNCGILVFNMQEKALLHSLLDNIFNVVAFLTQGRYLVPVFNLLIKEVEYHPVLQPLKFIQVLLHL